MQGAPFCFHTDATQPRKPTSEEEARDQILLAIELLQEQQLAYSRDCGKKIKQLIAKLPPGYLRRGKISNSQRQRLEALKCQARGQRI
jgi:hypothetical protein